MQQFLFIVVAILTALLVQFYNMDRLNRKFIANDQCFLKEKYWAAERFSIIGIAIFIILFCIIFPAIVKEKNISIIYQYAGYTLAGGIGNAIAIFALGKSKTYLKKKIAGLANDDNSTKNDEQ